MKEIKSFFTLERLRQYGVAAVGALIYCCAQLVFVKPLHIPMGGVAGISMLLNYLTELPYGAIYLVLNIPLLVLGFKTMNREVFVKTLLSVGIISLLLSVLEPIVPAYQGETMLAALYGGIVLGVGNGLVFLGGSTTGGIDILAKYVNAKTDLPIGTFNLSVNAVVICVSALVYKSVDAALYAIITTYLSSTVVDRLVYGADVQRNALIITTEPEAVSDAIMKTLGRGVTGLFGKGMYTGQERTVLLCVVRRPEAAQLKQILRQTDHDAFMMLGSVSEVYGHNFKNLRDRK